MKKFKRVVYFLITPIIIVCFIFSFKTYLSISNFNAENVKINIQHLSSDKFKGRLCGTKENEEAGEYIKQQFIKIGLEPLNNSYTESFTVRYPKIIENKSPYLVILDKDNKIIKTFKYGIDYKENPENFKSNSIKFTIKDSQFLSNNLIRVYQNNNLYMFYVPKDDELNFRSSFFYESPINMAIMITRKSYSEIKTYLEKGCSIKCFIPIEIEKTTVQNIVGVLKGSNPKLPPIILSAHFDHMGYDLNGTIYNGALDNASGTSYIIEMAKYLKNIGTPKSNVIFVAFNGEEFGFKGSTYFANIHKDKIKDSKVFNFDMVGGSESAPLCIMGGKNDTSKTNLIREISRECTNKHLYFNYIFENSSDHSPFREMGIDAVTFCDNDMSKIHTPKDKVEYINIKTIKRCFEASSPKILEYCYGNNIFIFHYKEIMLSCIVVAIILLVIKKWDCI